jgi:hypothetical protein
VGQARSLAVVPARLLELVAGAKRGVVEAGWAAATRLDCLFSTFPSSSAPAWLTAITGALPTEHGVAGMVYRVPGSGYLINAVTGQVLSTAPADRASDRNSGRVGLDLSTVFERISREHRGTSLMLGRELTWLDSAWARALRRGATLGPSPDRATLAHQARHPALLAEAIRAEISAALALADRPALLWVYVNLDDYIHSRGYDDNAIEAVRRLGRYAQDWAAQGFTVVALSDHGQVPCNADGELIALWSTLDTKVDCFLPSGGAGRVRWLYAYPQKIGELAERAARCLGDAASVHTAAELGLDHGALAGRVGAVVVVARTARFPVPDPSLCFEHGACDPQELHVPLAIWR